MTSVSVVFLTYNRSDLLQRTIESIRAALSQLEVHAEFVISDDASDRVHRVVIDGYDADKKLFASSNQGLGASSNRGIAAANFDLILQIQDDCEFCGSPEALRNAFEILMSDSEVGVVQLASSMEAPVKSIRQLGNGAKYVVFENDLQPRQIECGLRPYSDQPHLKRREFCDAIGRYREGAPMTVTELDFQLRVANQTRWYVSALEGSKLFRHNGGNRSFNPSVRRNRRIQRLESIPVLGVVLQRLRMALRLVRSHVLKQERSGRSDL